MWGIVVIGKPRNLEDFCRGIAALIIAKINFKDANVVINGEIPLKSYPGNKRFDHVILKANIPLDIKGLLDYGERIMIVEDSTLEKRLIDRRNELSYVDASIKLEFLHVKPKTNSKLILSLQRNKFYTLEV